MAPAACGEPEPSAPGDARVVLEVDPDGVFVSTEPVRGEWFAGFDVRCLLPPAGATDQHVLVGRIGGETPVLVERRDGALDSLRPTLRQVERSLLPELTAAAAAVDLPGPRSPEMAALRDGVRSVVAEPAPERPPLPPRAKPAERRDPPLPEGAPLMAWAPEGTLVVRFRSIEAAFRFADLADGLAAQLAAAQGEGGDHGTLRLTLHHLLLPSIWRANPNGRKGVSECALIVAQPLRAGALDAAVVLRIVDPELHDHETRAGIALESRPEHLWRPQDDPFPVLRVRSAVRAVAGDCEVVATRATLLERILAGPGRSVDAWTADAVAARHGLPAGDRRRAFTLCTAPAATIWRTLEAARTWSAGHELAARWLGLAVPPRPADFGGPEPVAAPWSEVLAVTADTDAGGATVNVRLANEEAAVAIGDRLRALPGDPARLAQACRGNLLALAPLGLVEPRTSDVAERAFVWFGRRPVCPCGGAYRFHPVTGTPSCSVHGDLESGLTEQAPPPTSPVSDVVVLDTLVTFRLSIDW